MRVVVGDIALDLTADQVTDLREQLGVDQVPVGGNLLTAAQMAERIGFSVDYVREHAAELGGRKMGSGPKSQWRFNPADFPGAGKTVEESPTLSPRRRPPRRAGSGQLLQSRG
jgi:hypothetical protein